MGGRSRILRLKAKNIKAGVILRYLIGNLKFSFSKKEYLRFLATSLS